MGTTKGNIRRPTLLVVDAMSQIFRAFYAYPALSITNPKGEIVHTSAVYGFIHLLLRVIDEVRPEYVAVAFDTPAPTFRKVEFSEYKANREAPPDELVPQFDKVRQVVTAFGIPRYELPGYEADDILGFMARDGVDQGLHVLLATGDRDTFQLINDNVGVITTNHRSGEPLIYDAEKVAQRWAGLRPAQIIDLKALQGDASDNIPGVPGIGEKTAVELLNKYGNLDTVLSNVNLLTGRARKALSIPENQDLAHLSRKLATILTDLPLELDLDKARLWQPDRNQIRAIFEELQFSSLEKRLPFSMDSQDEIVGNDRQLGLFSDRGAEVSALQIVIDRDSIDTLRQALNSVDKMGLYPVIQDTTRGPELVGLGLSSDCGSRWYIPIISSDDDIKSEILPLLGEWLGDTSADRIAYQSKELLRSLHRLGIDTALIEFDAGVGEYLLGNSVRLNTLDEIALNRVQMQLEPPVAEWPRDIGLAGLQPDVLATAASDRAASLIPISKDLHADLKDRGLEGLFNDVEMPLIPVLARMEGHGIKLDSELLSSIATDLGIELDGLRTAIHEDAGRDFRINSPKQLGVVLFEELNLDPGPKTASGQYSTSRRILEERREAHPIIDRVLLYRELDKLKGTYVDALPALVNPSTGRLHTSFSQTVTATGRLSSNRPNLQNIPIRTERGQIIRKAFIAENNDSVLLAADYSQIELRVLAHISNDQSMIQAFIDDEDIHTSTAAQMFEVAPSAVTTTMRRVAKTTNFGIIYGITSHGLAARTDLSQREAADLIGSYFKKYPAIRTYMDGTIKSAHARGYVSTLLGRRRYLSEMRSRNHTQRQAGERMAINMPIQGTAADIMKIAMIEMDRRLAESSCPARMILQVHDELLFELPKSDLEEIVELTREVMENAFQLLVPLKVDIAAGVTWGDLVSV